MSNIFIKRVAKLLDGVPMRGGSEGLRPIRAAAGTREAARKSAQSLPSEFDLHNQVLHNTWGRIEFEIEPLNPSCTPALEREQKTNSGKKDLKVTVRTRCRVAPVQSPGTDAKDKAEYLTASSGEFAGTLVPERAPLPLSNPRQILPILTDTVQAKALPLEEIEEIQKKEAQRREELKRETEEEEKQKQRLQMQAKLQTAKRNIRKEFACRESRRMLTLINERKAQAQILKEKSVFVNFSLPVLETLAKSVETPKAALKWLAFHESPIIRKAVARNKNTDLEILGILARDEDESIRMTVAENPIVDKEFLLKLLNDDMGNVVEKSKSVLSELMCN